MKSSSLIYFIVFFLFCFLFLFFLFCFVYLFNFVCQESWLESLEMFKTGRSLAENGTVTVYFWLVIKDGCVVNLG